MSPLRAHPTISRRKPDPIGQAVFYPTGSPSSPLFRRASPGRASISTATDSTFPPTPPATSPRWLVGTKAAPTFYIAGMSNQPSTPGRAYRDNDAVSPTDVSKDEASEFPFPSSSSSSSTLAHINTQFVPPSPHGLSAMIENWNLATPPNHPPHDYGDASGLPPSSSIDSISTAATELRSPPELPSSQGFHSRVLLDAESPAQALRRSISRPKPPRRSSESQGAGSTARATPYSPIRPTVTIDRADADLAGSSPGSRSPAPIPFRQPSWSNVRQNSIPTGSLGVYHAGTQSPLFSPPSTLFTPPPAVYNPSPTLYTPASPPSLFTSSPLAFTTLDDAAAPRVPSPLSFDDIFSPSYTMAGPSSFPPQRLPNALELNLGPIIPPATVPGGDTFGSFSLPAHPHEISGVSDYSQSTETSSPDPTKSTIAAKHLEGHHLPVEFLTRYTLADELGSGGFGFVCSATTTGNGNERGREVAVKFIFKERLENTKDALVDREPMESWALRQCNHPNIIAWVDLFEDQRFFILVQELHGDPWSEDHTLQAPHPVPEPHTDPGRRLSLLQTPAHRSPSPLVSPISPLQPFSSSPNDFASTHPDGSISRPRMGRRASHDLFEAVESVRFTEEEAKWIFSQIVSAVSYLHRRGMYHRDLKDENIVIDRYLNVKIIDFGSAVKENTLLAPILYGSFRGTYSYASAEVISGAWYHAAPCDIWSIGIILSILLTGEQPFPDKTLALAGKFKLKRAVSEGARDLLEKIFRPDPTRRWGIEKIERHKWLRNVKRPRGIPSPPHPAAPSTGSAFATQNLWDRPSGGLSGSMAPPSAPAPGAYRFGALPPLPEQATLGHAGRPFKRGSL